MHLKIFQAIVLICLLFFTIFISDFRNKKGMVSLINFKLISTLKILYLIPIFIYIYVILNIKNIFFTNYIGLFFTISGTFLVIKGKLDLGKYHTWAGHILSSGRIITKGIYAFIKHPMYTGIFLFILGGLIIGINNNPFSLFFTFAIIIFIIIIKLFLITTAIKENRYLQEKFQEEYIKYKNQVHAFLPIRKYNHALDDTA